MINAHVEMRSPVPWWAAFGAPLLGVPLLVILLALGAPKQARSNPANAPDAYTNTEQVEVAPAARATAELPPAHEEDAAPPRC
jgi:hypothetical protein